MKYINVITGNTIDIDSEIRGENWELVRASDSLEEKAGEIEEARKLYEEVIKNGNKLYIVEEAKEKLNKM